MKTKRKHFRRRRKDAASGRGPTPSASRHLWLEALERRDLLAVDATLALGRPTFDGTTANFEVEIDYAATAGEELVFFSLDAAPSSPTLIGPGPDFSAFSFTAASPLLDDWTQIGFFNDPFFESTVEFDDSLIAPLAAGTYTLGTLSVDFGAAGLSFGDIFTVSLEGFDTVIGVEDSSGFRFEPVNFDPGERTVVPVTLSGASNVDEGDAYTLTIETLFGSGFDIIIAWGDGTEETIDVGDLPASGEVLHTYADGLTTPTILVDVETASGTRATAGELELTVDNVAPTVALSGAASVEEGSLYTLTIGAVSDPGDDTVTQYIIDWGDGQQDTINAADLPASREVTHTFADGITSPTILVDLVDEDGTHANAGELDITVDNVSPTVALSGDASVDEGSPYILTIGTVSDPGDDSVTQYVVRWGDGQQQSINTADLPANGEVTHTYADGIISPTIRVDLVDEDGTHTDAGVLDLTVNNVTPTVGLSGEASVDEGSPYTLTIGAVSDPGDDSVAQYIIHWGDGQQETLDAVDLPASREAVHVYADGPLSPTIIVDLVDEDGTHTDAGVLDITVNNVAPTLTLDAVTMIAENGIATLTGTIVDPGTLDTFTLSLNWGDPLSPDDDETYTFAASATGSQTFTLTHQYLDDNPTNTSQDTYTISGTVTDDDTLSGSDSTTVLVNNIAPEIVPGSVTFSATRDSKALPGDFVTVSAQFTDVGMLDTHNVIVNWDDGTTSDSSATPGDFTGFVAATGGAVGSFTAQHSYTTGGIFIVTVTVLDDDTGTAATAIESWVTGVRLVDTTGELQIVGTSAKDIINVHLVGGSDGGSDGDSDGGSDGGSDNPRVKVIANFGIPAGSDGGSDGDSDGGSDGGAEIAYFDQDSVTSIRIVLCEGDDHAKIGEGGSEGGSDGGTDWSVPAIIEGDAGDDHLTGGAGNDLLDGGEGDDKLRGGGGNNTLFGGPGDDDLKSGTDGGSDGAGDDILDGGSGDDKLQGGKGRDVLIGGTGKDDLKGKKGDDLLVAGFTSINGISLQLIMSEWSSSNSYETRTDNIKNGTGPALDGTGIRLQAEGSVDDRTVFDDAVKDKLKGDQDRDWFFADLDNSNDDDVKDQKNDEFLEQLSDPPAGAMPQSWTNPFNELDVNQDGFVSPLDVLIVINLLEAMNDSGESPELPPVANQIVVTSFYDVNDDGFVTPLDVLRIINALDLADDSSGEGEGVARAEVPHQARAERWDDALQQYLEESESDVLGKLLG